MIELLLTFPEKNQTYDLVEIYKDDNYIGMIMLQDPEVMIEIINILQPHYKLKRTSRNKVLG